MQKLENDDAAAAIAGGWLAALGMGHVDRGPAPGSSSSCTVSASGSDPEVRDSSAGVQANSIDVLSQFLAADSTLPQNVNKVHSHQPTSSQLQRSHSEETVMNLFKKRESEPSLSPTESSPSLVETATNLTEAMYLSQPTHAINAISSTLAHSAPRRLSLALAAAANLSSSRSSLPSSTSTESLSLLSSNGNTSPPLYTTTQGHWSQQSHRPRQFQFESQQYLFSHGTEGFAAASSASTVSMPSPVDHNSYTPNHQFQQINNEECENRVRDFDRLQHAHSQLNNPVPPVHNRDRSNSSHDIAIFLSQGLPQRIGSVKEHLPDSAHDQRQQQQQEEYDMRQPYPTELEQRNETEEFKNTKLPSQHHQRHQHQQSQPVLPPPSPLKRLRAMRSASSGVTPSSSSLYQQQGSGTSGTSDSGGAATGSSSSSNVKSYPCLVPGCNKVFPRAYNLKSHSYCHSGERPHKCNLCTATFSRKHDLQRHVRTLHAKERPHVCSICEQGFLNPDQLRRHIVTSGHTEDFQLACSQTHQTQRDDSPSHSLPRRSSISTNASNSGTGDGHLHDLSPRDHSMEASLPNQLINSIMSAGGLTEAASMAAAAAAAADWVHSSNPANSRQPHTNLTASAISNMSSNRSSGTVVEFADGGFPGMPEPVSIPGMDDARVETALRKRRASGTTGGSIGVLALAAEAELQRQSSGIRPEEEGSGKSDDGFVGGSNVDFVFS
ncbi:Metallothionein expression activator [Chytriomyces hyalinus]|nr:Metallothionein expression activator [Chytriomyces hyalinus]